MENELTRYEVSEVSGQEDKEDQEDQEEVIRPQGSMSSFYL